METVVIEGHDRVFVRGPWRCALVVPAGVRLVADGQVQEGALVAVPFLGTRARRAPGETMERVRGDWVKVDADQVGEDVSGLRAVVRAKPANDKSCLCIECGKAEGAIYGRCEWCAMAVAGSAA